MEREYYMKRIFCLLVATILLTGIFGTAANAILNAASVFGDGQRAVEQQVYPYNPTPAPAEPVQYTPVPQQSYTGVTTPSETVQRTPLPQQQPATQGEYTISLSLTTVTDSNTITAVGYHEGTMILAVQMLGTGEIRCYRPVSKIIYMKFMESTAKDTFFTNQIDGRYERIQ